jgi:hypothetical protein
MCCNKVFFCQKTLFFEKKISFNFEKNFLFFDKNCLKFVKFCFFFSQNICFNSCNICLKHAHRKKIEIVWSFLAIFKSQNTIVIFYLFFLYILVKISSQSSNFVIFVFCSNNLLKFTQSVSETCTNKLFKCFCHFWQ